MKRMVWIAIALWAPICSCLLCSMGDTVSEPRRVVHQFGIDSITLFTSTPTATSTPSTNPVQPPTQQEASAPTPDTSVRRATPTKSPTTPTIPPTRTPPPPTTTALPTSRPSPSPTQPQPFTTATATSLPSNPPDSPNLPNLPEQTPSPSPTPTTIPSATPPNALPEVSFNNSAQQADENNGLVTLNVSLNTPATQPITVTYATHDVTANAGSDYLAVTGLINLTIGQTVVPVSIVITNDTLIEPDEAFQVTLQQASNATLGVVSTSTITIKSDDGLTVNTTDDSDDGSCDTTHCTLREAINSANNNPGLDTILFNIPGGGPYTIRPTSPIPTITESIMVDGLTQPGADCTHWPPTLLIELDGSNAGVDTNGLSLMADDSNIQGLVINRFGRDGIHLQADRNRITCNFIGTDPSGIIAFGNADDGIDINQGANNQIGGASDTDRNLIAANLNDGIYIRENSQFNRIEGNYIGTDATGLIRLGNNGNGIQISLGATANNIGGAQSITASGCSEVCNLISGNRQNGIWIRHNTTTSNSIQSNYIGTTIVGTIALSNGIDGIKIEDSPNNIIGGLQASEGNLISGNGNTGILMIGTTATNNTIAGNYIGTDSTGTVALGNNNDGILIRSLAANNIIGGATTAQGNLISGNHIDGIGISAAAFNNQLQNNYIGTDITGSLAIGNGGTGIDLTHAHTNLIGGGPGLGNLVSGNQKNGIRLLNTNSINNRIQGNKIGTNLSGTASLPNTNHGLVINNASNNTVGGVTTVAGNLISGNNKKGIFIVGSNSMTNTVQNNIIGTDQASSLALGNGQEGVNINNQATYNSVISNTIAYNSIHGIAIESDAKYNILQANNIFSNTNLGINLAGGIEDGFQVTADDLLDSDVGSNDLQNRPVLTAAISHASLITVTGSLSTTPNQLITLEFFVNNVCDPSGQGEGEQWIGTHTIATDGAGLNRFTVNFPIIVPINRYITATATDPNDNTSEFSNCQAVMPP